MATKWVYYFGETGKKDKLLVGGKGANLSEMTKMGLPIPTGYTISMRACIAYQGGKGSVPGMQKQIDESTVRLQKVSGKTLNDPNNPLLLSVRSGSSISMPGMMDTVLNLGMNEQVVAGMAKKNPRFAFDAYRRFITMFSDVVMGVDRMKFEHAMDKIKDAKGYKQDTDMQAADLTQLCQTYLQIYKKETGQAFPTDPTTQLGMAVDAVFKSWNNPRAIKYRQLNHIPDDLGTAVTVQEMVFGNMGSDCATGVAFTRNPSTGENKRYGEYLANAQGEDVVAGIRTPLDLEAMRNEFPECAAQLFKIFDTLEDHYRDMQDIEFTVEKNKLFILQTRNGKRTAGASLKMAVDMIDSGFITKKEGVMRVTPTQLETLMHPQLDPIAAKAGTVVATGLPASPGAAVGQVCFTSAQAVALKEKGGSAILVRVETSPEDITGMASSVGILTARGGMTSHAAVVARGMNVCCIAGCSALEVNEEKNYFVVAGQKFGLHDYISLDGSVGKVYKGKLAVKPATLSGDFAKLLGYSDEFRTMGVRANADTPKDSKIARDFGAQGIGLTRTEHMFFDSERILFVREMILAETTEARVQALDKLLPFQRSDFTGILNAMDGLPVVIRLIDPPLHEFLPHELKDQQELAQLTNRSLQDIQNKVESLSEFNPMLGFRGCRLGVVYPEINAMQVRAIFEAALALKKQGKTPLPCIEVPLVGNINEFLPLKNLIKKLAKETGAEGVVKYEVGTMIEVPRAALTADELAAEADFLSFGTNDLTQMTCGFSRDDAGAFLKEYVAKGLYTRDPFQSVDQSGVGKLMRICVTLARSVKPNIDIGICGEHGGEPNSVEFCHRIGLDNVSCSPFRVPVARLAAAQAAIKFGPPNKHTPQSIFLKSAL